MNNDIANIVWRSLLFIPADNRKFIDKAHERGADACILDLEDAIALDRKAVARAGVATAAHDLKARGCDVLVRVDKASLAEDIAASVCEAVSALVLPKVNSAADVQRAAELIDAAEKSQRASAGRIRIIAQIEEVGALPHLDEIAAASPRLLGMSLGSEDFSVSAGMQPTRDTLYWPNQQVVFACRRAGILPFGFPLSIGVIDDTETLTRAITLASDMGCVGALCIHPAQVAILNRHFTPDECEVETALALLDGYERAQREGQGAFAFNGKMVDPPVAARARELVARARAIRR